MLRWMSPFDIFNPMVALDPSTYTGAAGASRLAQAAAQFPGGPTALVFALFWAPVGPGIPAGVLLAHHLRISPITTFGLYTLSDVLAILLLNPVYSWLRSAGRRNPRVRTIGRRVLRVAMIGVRPPTPEMVRSGQLAPTLLRIATVGFGVDIYTAGAIATGLPIPRIPGWAAALVGDLLWFLVLLGASIVTAQIVDDERWVMVVVIAIAFIGPALLRRIFPSLR
jgi:hypothetical protein